MKIQPVILSGGSGTRLWPLSREHFPKQLLALCGQQTMLQETIRRLESLEHKYSAKGDFAVVAPILVCNEQHRFLIAEQVREIGVESAAIILEPVGKNTAPALTLAALTALEMADDAVMLVMPADHVVKKVDVFHDAIRHGFTLAKENYIVTFGIIPTAPETGYGYIRAGGTLPAPAGSSESLKAQQIAAFVEKPDCETATAYLEAGNYFWNSGIFMMRASLWMKEIENKRSDIASICRQAFQAGKHDSDFRRIDEKTFQTCPSDSIDYAVMEKIVADHGDSITATKAAVIPIDVGWSDVGAWNALWEVMPGDEDGNVTKGDVIAYDTNDSLVMAEHRLVAAVGVKDLVIIETADAVLVADKKNAQHVKKIVQHLKDQQRGEHVTHRRVFRPWGSYEGLDNGDRFQVKRIIVNPGAALSLQMHHHRAEHWIVVRGTAKVTCGDKAFLLTENQSTYIPLGIQHRLENPGRVLLEMIEVQSGSYLGEDDIVRFEDVYGRSQTN